MPLEAPVTSARVSAPIFTGPSFQLRARRWLTSAADPDRGGMLSGEHATVAEEEYLQSMYWLMEAGLPITGANIARAMQLSPPTVHEMIGRLEQDGYVTRGDDKTLSFTDDGRAHAEQVVRRHRMIERFLTDVLGIPWDEVHEEAERLEHAMSPVLEERMMAAIGTANDLPPRPPDRRGCPRGGRPAGRRRGGRLRPHTPLRERGRGAAPLPQALRPEPGPRGHRRDLRLRRRHGSLRRWQPPRDPQRRRDGLGSRRSVPTPRAPLPEPSSSPRTATGGSPAGAGSAGSLEHRRLHGGFTSSEGL